VIGLLGGGRTPEGDMSEVTILKAHKTNKVLPPGYKLDHDPRIAILRRWDGSVVAYFPMWSFQPMLAVEEAEADLGRGMYGKDKRCAVGAVTANA
jgi:hypothetical protein